MHVYQLFALLINAVKNKIRRKVTNMLWQIIKLATNSSLLLPSPLQYEVADWTIKVLLAKVTQAVLNHNDIIIPS